MLYIIFFMLVWSWCWLEYLRHQRFAQWELLGLWHPVWGDPSTLPVLLKHGRNVSGMMLVVFIISIQCQIGRHGNWNKILKRSEIRERPTLVFNCSHHNLREFFSNGHLLRWFKNILSLIECCFVFLRRSSNNFCEFA